MRNPIRIARSRWRKRKASLLWVDGPFFMLVAATVTLLVAVVYGLSRVVENMSAGEALFRTTEEGKFSVMIQAWAIVSMLLFVGVGWGLWMVFRRRQSDQIRLRRSEEKYRNIINHAGEAIFLLDGHGSVLEWNKAAESLFAVPRRNVLGRPFRDIHLCYGVEIEQAMADATRLNRSLTFEFPLRRRGQDEVGELSLTVSPIASAHGAGKQKGLERQLSFVVLARDITSEKQLESRMSETEKLAGIGQFAAGIAHQLNTPLGSILLSAQMLEENVDNEDNLEDVGRIIRQTEQCRGIIKGLLNFARPSGEQKGRVVLAEVMRETVFLMEKPIRSQNVEVVMDIDDEGMIYGNRNELEQVVFNLLANAIDALQDGGRVNVSISEGEPGEVLFVFGDNGEGIPEEYRDQIFLPFFTTKEYGKGTGLGLSIVARIVHEHGGRIELAAGEGARFHMSFPRFRPSIHGNGNSNGSGVAFIDDLLDDTPESSAPEVEK